MSSSENPLINNNRSLLKIEVDDISNYFISYWNLALKKLLSKYFYFVNSDVLGQIKLPLNSFNIKLVNINNTLDNNFEDKLFLIKVYYLNSEKDLTKDYFDVLKNTYEDKNMNLVLISTDEIKKDISKECLKIFNKIKSKTGLNDLFYLPYSITNLDKINNLFNEFLNAFAYKFSKEYFVKINLLSEKLENFENFEIGNDDDKLDKKKNNKLNILEDDYKYIEDCIYYLDLLSQIKSWKTILSFTGKLIFKEFELLKDKINIKIKPDDFFDFDENKLKMSYMNKKLSNVEFNEYLVHYYLVSSHFLKKYVNITHIVRLISGKQQLFEKYFKTDYHCIFWMINYNYICIKYCDKILEQNIKEKNEINKSIIILYNLCIKIFIKYIYKYKKNLFIILNKNILNVLIKNYNQKNSNNIQEDLENIFQVDDGKDINKEIENNINLFINDINDDTKKNDKIYILLNDNKKLLHEISNLYKSINSKFKQLANINFSIQNFLDEIYLLISFAKFEEAKQLLVSALNHKYIKKNKFLYVHEYICLVLLLVLNYLPKNDENLNLIFKILNLCQNNSLMNKLLKNIGCDNNNIIYEIINKYLEEYDDKNNNEKEDVKLYLNNIFEIKLFSGEDKILFINKNKLDYNNKDKTNIKYQLTNKTGLELNIKKIIIIFEEINLNDKNNYNGKINRVLYEINEDKNTFKKIGAYINQKDEFIQIEFNNNLFKTNHLYKPMEIHYILKNSIKSIYKLKENIEIIISGININIKTELGSSNFYYNILSFMKINISDITDITDIKNNYIIINLNNQNESILKIQTELVKNNFINIFQNVKINDNCIEFPPDSIKNIEDLNTLEIPFFIENTDYYNVATVNKLELNIIIKKSKESKDNLFSYLKTFTPEFSHLFTIGKRFKNIPNKNTYLMQTFLTLNLENTSITVYNKDNTSVVINSKQAINLILILSEKEEEIIKKLRNSYIKFSIKEQKNIKYQFCYPEKNILEEIKEMKEIPYHITINLDKNCVITKIYNELIININIKKFKKEKTKLMVNIKENEQWSVVGRNKLIEEFEQNICERNVEITLLPLIDGFISLPEFEFNEICDSNDDNNVFEPIEYGSIIEGEKNIINIMPLKEYSLKINLT